MGATIMLSSALVRHLRKGLLLEMACAAEHLSILTREGTLTHQWLYDCALWRIDATSAMLKKTGLFESVSQDASELRSNDYPYLVFKVLESRHQAEVTRAQDAQAEGSLQRKEIDHALGELVVRLAEQMRSTAKVKEEKRYLNFVDRRG